MLKNGTKEKLDMLMNHFYGLAYCYLAVAAVLKGGYSHFAKWESAERWRTGDKIKRFIEAVGVEPKISKVAEPKQSFASIEEALSFLNTKEVETIAALESISKSLFDAVDMAAFGFVLDLIECHISDVAEVRGVLEDHRMVSGDKAGIYSHQSTLSRMYWRDQND